MMRALFVYSVWFSVDGTYACDEATVFDDNWVSVKDEFDKFGCC